MRLVNNQHDELLARPGETSNIDHSYCISEVRVYYTTLSGRFYSPRAIVEAEYKGENFLGGFSDYKVEHSRAYGSPWTEAAANADGYVTLCVPQGVRNCAGSQVLVPVHGIDTSTNLHRMWHAHRERSKLDTNRASLGRPPLTDLIVVHTEVRCGCRQSTDNAVR